eukprot:PhF_6_TR40330/c0_g1_i1/m.59960/K02542/MCM6; DNA replication licensing factor MCM6
MSNQTLHVDPTVVRVRDMFFNFLGRYLDNYWLRDGVDPTHRGEWFESPGQYYRESMSQLVQSSDMGPVEEGTETARRSLCVHWGHLVEYSAPDAEFIRLQYPKYRQALSEALYRVLTDIMGAEPKESHPLYYSVAFVGVPGFITVRSVRAADSGVLCNLKATVTRMTQVRPELVQASFSCQNCGTVSDPVVQEYTYTVPLVCKQDGCGNRDTWAVVHNRHTVICDWQKVKAQEDSEALLPGSTPRSIDIIIRGDFVERALPGDKVCFVGFVSIVPEVGKMFRLEDRRELARSSDDRGVAGGDGMQSSTRVDGSGEGVEGLKSLGTRILAYKLCFVAVAVTDRNGNLRTCDPAKIGEKILLHLTTEQERIVSRITRLPRFFDALISCVAPNVFAYKLVKLGLLLQLVGGVHKVTLDGTSLRGDINACLIGDPAVAKSHLLKWISKVAPRGIYTSGKTSTAAGLTASVARDMDTGEFTIEAGALMLADNGLCCIDEFEKMDPADMVAIHEAMEQQTISIAKAGIKATLKARASILAAANPIGGVYDISKPLHQNVMMTQPIMSRFDLIFILADTTNASDRLLAEKLTELHQRGEIRQGQHSISTTDFLLYVEYARSIEPRLTETSCGILATAFRDLRMEKTRTVTHRMFRYTTRQLESMIRLSEAVARLHLDTEVRPAHVNIALTLMRASMTHTELSSELGDEMDIEPVETQILSAVEASRGVETDDSIIRALLTTKVCTEVMDRPMSIQEICEWLQIASPEVCSRISSDILKGFVTSAVVEMLRTGILSRGPDIPTDTPILETDKFHRGATVQ